nr:hypothetical protein [Staphylococcus aureus]
MFIINFLSNTAEIDVVLTSGNQPFTYELPKDLSPHNARKKKEKYLRALCDDKSLGNS